MSRVRAVLVAVVTLLLSLPLAAADPPKPPLAQNPDVADAIKVFDAWVARTATDREQPAVSIGIVYDQDLIWAKGYGFANLEKKTPASPATAYRIASLSKLFTATAILQLRDAGKLQLDDPVSKWLPEFAPAKIDPNSPIITVRHLLTHTSGLPREVDGTYWNDMNFPPPEEMERILNTMGVVGPPETEWKYSNVALSLAGYVVEKASGEPYAEYIAGHILAPLGMTGTRVIPPSDMATLAQGYGRRVPGKPRRIEPFLNAAYMVPAANLASTVDDLAKFASLQFRDGAAGGTQILRGSTLKDMQRVHWLDPDWKSGWGLGWSIARRDDKVRIQHGGAVPGHRTQITLLPAEKFGVIVLTNAADGDPGRYINAAYKMVAPAVAKATAKKDEPPKTGSAWSKYVGTYAWKDDVNIVMVLNGELCIVDPSDDDPMEGRIHLEPVTANVFRMKTGSQKGELITFTLDEKGNVTRLSEPGDYMVRQP